MQRPAAADPYAMSTRSASLAVAAVLAAGALAIAASGCGSSQATLDPIAQAAEATTHSGGSQVLVTVAVEAPELGTPVTIKGNGEFNMARKEGELFLDIDGLPAGTQSALPGGQMSITELFKNDVIYMTSPLFEGKLPGGAKWMKLDLAKFESSLGIDAQSLSSGQSDPTQFLQYLRASGGAVTVAGHEAVRGAETTRYEASIDLEKAAEELPGGDSETAKAAIRALIAQTGVSTVPVTVWIDSQHLVRRMKMKLTTSEAGHTSAASIDYEMFGFGPSPAVNAPPGNETFDATNLSLQNFTAAG